MLASKLAGGVTKALKEKDLEAHPGYKEKIKIYMKSGNGGCAPPQYKRGRPAAGSSRAIVTLAKKDLVHSGGGGEGGGSSASGGAIVNNYHHGLGADAVQAAISGANDFLEKSGQQVDFAQWCAGVGNLIGAGAAAAAAQNN
eukprot:SAG31_NODE_12762_length_918_cov_1.836386_2_plen_142_part_00